MLCAVTGGKVLVAHEPVNRVNDFGFSALKLTFIKDINFEGDAEGVSGSHREPAKAR